MNVLNKILGAGNSSGVLIPKGLLVILIFFTVIIVMYLNGLYQYRSQFVKNIPSIAVSSLVIQMIAAFITRFTGKDNEPIYAAHEIVHKFYTKEEKNERHGTMLNTTIDKAILALKAYILTSFMFYHTPVAVSLILSIVKRDYVIALNMCLPYTDLNTLIGFFINMILTTFASTLLWFLLGIREIQAIFYPMQFVSMIEIFKMKLEKFGEQLSEKSPEPSTSQAVSISLTEHSRVIIEKQLIDLIKEFEACNQYKSHCLDYMEYMAFIALSTNSVSIGLCLLYIRLFSVPIGLSLGLLFAFQVFIPCVIGTIISTQNEKLLQAVCEFPWYKLSPKMMKVYLQFIHQCQNTTEFELPIVGEFNMELFTHITHASYSFLAYLLNFI
jgi:hypothetical protein